MKAMPKRKKKVDFNAPATKGDVEELALLSNKNFERMEQNMPTKEEVTKLHAKIDNLEKKREQDTQDIIREFRSSVELQKADLEEAHQDELASVEGKKDAPTAWKSIPRRLTSIEMDVEKIKDHLEIS